mmetsp:Transcript_24044/g.29107  ORF Transcript_24044/g.29107 Transcript_24044/m.29107 type:complete len:97 (+) Transcript_24044:1320-1610(+)
MLANPVSPVPPLLGRTVLGSFKTSSSSWPRAPPDSELVPGRDLQVMDRGDALPERVSPNFIPLGKLCPFREVLGTIGTSDSALFAARTRSGGGFTP